MMNPLSILIFSKLIIFHSNSMKECIVIEII